MGSRIKNTPVGNLAEHSAKTKKKYAIALTALSLVADEINAFEDPEELRKHLIRQNARPQEEQKREAHALIAKAKKLVSHPV